MTGLLFQDYVQRLDQKVDHDVLLLIDGGPHGMGDYVPRHVKAVVLPSNTTSQIQPLDAGIIQAFKMRYRHRMLEYTLLAIEKGLPPYDVDQLQAMRGVRAVWNEVPNSCIQNCWNHTHINETSEMALLQQQISRLQLLNPMAIEEFVSPLEDIIGIRQLLSDEELIGASTVSPKEDFLSTALPASQEELDDEIIVHPTVSWEEKAKIFRRAMRYLEEEGATEERVHNLGRFTWSFTREMELRAIDEQVQASITQFFK